MSLAALLVMLGSCGGSGGGGNPVGPANLGAVPQNMSPASGAVLTTDTPTFTVQNASGYDAGSGTYTFQVLTASGTREVATQTVNAGSATTSATFTSPLPRGMNLSWRVTARNASASVASTATSFRLPAVDCRPAAGGFARSVVSVSIPVCARRPNLYNDPSSVLGAPDTAGAGPDDYTGFLSLGEGGHVVVDMEQCVVDGAGHDLRVYQAVASEPVTVYAAGQPSGPFQLLAARVTCGDRATGFPRDIKACDFDLGAAEVQEARYFKIEDGELYPCALAETTSEGADIDAVGILNGRP